jgi:hypothetical protein
MLALLYEIISQLGNLLALVNVLRGQGTKQAVENIPYEIDTATQELLAIQQDSSISNAAIRSTIDTNATLATAQYDDLVVRLGLLQTSAGPVTLPTVPPAGYGSTDVTGVPDAVWGFLDPVNNTDVLDLLSRAGYFAFLANAGFRLSLVQSPHFYVEANDQYGDPGGMAGPPGVPWNPVDILAGETLIANLQRQMPTWSWTDADNYPFHASEPVTAFHWTVYCDLTPEDFALLEAQLHPKLLVLPPVWPGLDNVTLGSSVALAPNLTIAEPMDGVIIALSSVPSPRGYYSYDGLKAYQQIGALTFLSDNGDAEYIQALGFTEQVYAPKLMVRAAAVKIRTSPGVTGTVTPWVIGT